MHIMEGFLDIYWCIFWFLLCIPFIVYGAYQLRKVFKQAPEQKLTVAISGAFIFVLSSLKLPSVTGSSSHPTGTGLSTILAGPWVTSILASIVLIFQALLLAHGGLTTLGANVFSMGIVGPFIAYGVYRTMARLKAHPVAAVFVTAFMADFATYLMTSLQLALAYPSNGMILPSLATFLGIFAITQVPLAVVESILIVMFFDYLANLRPELTRPELLERKGRKFGWVSRTVVGAVVIIAIISVPFLLYEGQVLEGADDQGGGAISDIDPDYRPWFQSLFEPSEALEPYLFYLQAFIGLAVLLLVIFLTRRRKRYRGATKPRLGMDELAHQSPMRDWPPLGKLLLTLSLLVVSLLSQSVIVPALIFIFGLGMLFYSSRLQMPRIVALALLDGLLIILIGCLVIAFLTTGGSLYARFEIFGLDLTVYENGIDLATMVLFRALAGMTVMLVFITSTPVPHLAHALRQLRIPQEVVELTILVYRYSFLLLEQLEVMHVAASNRLGFHGTRNRVRTSSKLAVGLFSRSMEIASRSQVALQCRNFNGEFPTFRPPRKLTWEWILVPLLLASVIYLWNLVLLQMMG